MNNNYTLIITSGKPEDKFGLKLLEKQIKTLEALDKPYKVIDLYKDKFNPIFIGKDLALYSKSQTTDKLVIKYQKLLKEAKELVFIYKTKLGNIESLMKGFMDKTFLGNGFFHVKRIMNNDITIGDINWIDKASIFTYEEEAYSKASKIAITQIKLGILKTLGIKNLQVSLLSDSNNPTKQKEFLKKI